MKIIKVYRNGNKFLYRRKVTVDLGASPVRLSKNSNFDFGFVTMNFKEDFRFYSCKDLGRGYYTIIGSCDILKKLPLVFICSMKDISNRDFEQIKYYDDMAPEYSLIGSLI